MADGKTHGHHAIDYVEFTAQDLGAIKKFYARVFGWTFTDYGPEYAAFDGSGIEGGFAHAAGKSTDGAGRGGLVILYSRALEDTQREVLAAGGRIARAIFSFPGGRRFHFLDPAGNELAVWSDR